MSPKPDLRNRKRLYSVVRPLLFASLLLAGMATPQKAAIIPTGDVEPVGTWSWAIAGYVGKTSDGSLVVNAGSLLQSFDAYIAYDSGVSGTATITGGSKWTNEMNLFVGNKGNGTLRIESGGQVYNLFGYLGYDAGSSGTAIVTGSKWTNHFELYVGKKGTGTLRIEAGGQVSNDSDYYHSYIGYDSGSSGSVTVTGAGSQWIDSIDIYVGRDGTGTLTVADGGKVTTDMLYASLENLFGNGTITATMGAVLDADFRFDAAHGTQQTFAFGSGGTLTVTAAGGVIGAGYKGNGSLTVAEGVAIISSSGYLGYYAGSSGVATVTGTGSKWTNNYTPCYIGYYGTGILRINAGGQVSDSVGYLGYNSGSSGTATVTGAGSKWTNSGDLYVGRDGAGTLTVADGGEVITQTLYASLGNLFGNGKITATAGAVLDADFRFGAAHPTQAAVAFGSGGILTVTAAGGVLGAGYKGNGSLTVAEGVAITSSSGYLGYNSGSSGTATITGAGSKWTNSGSLYVGQYGSGTLSIEAGGQVSNVAGYLGYGAGSSSTAIVTGAGSKWTNSGDLYVARDGAGTLTVADGGEVTAQTLYASVGSLYGNGTITAIKGAILDADFRFGIAHPTQAAVAFGSGGMLTVTAAGGVLGAGYKGNGSLTVAEGVAITSSSGYLGYNSGSSGTATITGARSRWTNSGSLYVGRYGSGTLHIEAGGQASNWYAYLGYDSGSSGSATVTGTGSKWTNSGELMVGTHGIGTLRIEAGGYILSSSGLLGFDTGSSGSATITGAGSMWIINTSGLDVGGGGTGTLRIEAGGQVTCSYISYIGRFSGSAGTATITGVGSKWTNGYDIYVGGDGNGTLHIRDGGMVTASSLSINSSSLLTIDAGYSSNLRIGSNGTGTITNNGKIRALVGPQQAVGSQYVPITSGPWSGTGTYEALGGTWNTTSHVFTVSQTLGGASGTPLAVDLAQQQRVLVTETARGWTIGASFLEKTGAGNAFNFTATTIASTDLNALLDPGQIVLRSWKFTAAGNGYNADDPTYLSLDIPKNLASNDLQFWRLSGGTWSRFTADDLTTHDGYASFVITGLNGYTVAVSSVAEPSAILILLTVIACLPVRFLLARRQTCT